MNLKGNVYSHTDHPLPVAVCHRLPTELVDETRVWATPQLINGFATLGRVGPKWADLWVHATWLPGYNAFDLVPTWNKGAPELKEITFQATGDVGPDAIFPHSERVAVRDANKARLVYHDAFIQIFYLEAFQYGRKIWIYSYHSTLSNVVRFEGKIEASDPNIPTALLMARDTISATFPNADRVFFFESMSDTLSYEGIPIADGAAVPFSGYLIQGQEELLPMPTGPVDGVLMFPTGESVFDGRLPFGLRTPMVRYRSKAWESMVTTASMLEHPVGEKRYTHATGDRQVFGCPGTETQDPKLIDGLRRAASQECLRPIQRLETDGKPFTVKKHRDAGKKVVTHNQTGSSQAGDRNGFYFGKPKSEGTRSGVPKKWWDLQGGEHDSFHPVTRFFVETGSMVAADTMDRSSELLSCGADYWIERHFVRTCTHMAEWAIACEDPELAARLVAKIGELITQRLDWMGKASNAGIAANAGGAQPYAWMKGYSANLVPPQDAASPMQNGLVTMILPVVDALKAEFGFVVDERFYDRFERIVEWLIADAYYQDPMGRWLTYWVVGDHGAVELASSHRLIMLQGAAGLAWYLKRHPEQSRCRMILQSIWGDDSDCARYLSCWITGEELFSLV